MLTKFILIRSETNAVIFEIYRLGNFLSFFFILFSYKRIYYLNPLVPTKEKPHCENSIRVFLILKFS